MALFIDAVSSQNQSMFRDPPTIDELLSRRNQTDQRLALAMARRVQAPDNVTVMGLPDGFSERNPNPFVLLSQNERLDTCIENAADGLAVAPTNADLIEYLAECLLWRCHVEGWRFHRGLAREAMRLMEPVAAIRPSWVFAVASLAAGRSEQAMEHATTHATVAEAELIRAVTCDLHDRDRDALVHWRNAFKNERASLEIKALAAYGLAETLVKHGDMDEADARFADALYAVGASRYLLCRWASVKFKRAKYSVAWELNRRALTFGYFDRGVYQRHEFLDYFRRLGFVPEHRPMLDEELKRGVDGLLHYVGGERTTTGEIATSDDDDEFIPTFRVNLFIEGETPPRIADIASPDASFEGRAKLEARVLDPRTLQPVEVDLNERFRTGQYVLSDQASGAVFHVLLMKRRNLHNPYLDLPERDREVFDFDRTLMQRFENAPWDVRLLVADHGFDPMQGVLAACKLCDSFLRHAGGIGVDLETGRAITGGQWRNEGPQSFDVTKHVHIEAVESNGRVRLQTHGLCKFLRPELRLESLALDQVEHARSVLVRACDMAARGRPYRAGDRVGSKRAPMVLNRVKDPKSRHPVLALLDWAATGKLSMSSGRGILGLLK